MNRHSSPEHAPVRPFATGSRFYLRDLDLVLSTRWHPDTDTWFALSPTWIEELLDEEPPSDRAILENTVRDSVWWACLCYPNTADQAWMNDLVRMAIAWIVLDDYIYTSYLTDGRIGEVCDEFTAAVSDPGFRPLTRMGRFAAATWESIAQRIPPGLQARWVSATQDYARGITTEIAARAAGREYTDEEYRWMREDSMGAAIVHIFGEYSRGIDMSDEIAQSPEVFKGIWEVAGAHFMYVNDLLTFRKEYCDGDDFHHNLVYTGVVKDGLTLQQSVNRLCDQVEKTEHRYRTLCHHVMDQYRWAQPKRMLTYLRQVEHGMAGSRDYSYVAARYHGDGFARAAGNCYLPAKTSGWLTLQPHTRVFLDQPECR